MFSPLNSLPIAAAAGVLLVSGCADTGGQADRAGACIQSNGELSSFNAAVAERLDDPRSFEHVSTELEATRDGRRLFRMSYRQSNPQGGISVDEIWGWLDISTCSATYAGTRRPAGG